MTNLVCPLSKTTLTSDMISKYLVQYVPPTPKSRKTDAQRVTGARVLTRAQGLAILKEKERRRMKQKKKRRSKRGLTKRNRGKNWPRRKPKREQKKHKRRNLALDEDQQKET